MLKLREDFAGIGAFSKALKNVGIEFKTEDYCEIDKYASKSYSVIHNISEDKNRWDITKTDETKLEYADLYTYGFPCQDISVAGKQAGINENTRSGLLYDALRIIKHTKPKIAIAENVKNLVGKKFKDDFNNLLKELELYGYTNYWKVLNAKDHGIPQNRERVFIVSIRNDIKHEWKWPEPFDNGLRLKDMLEDEVNEKYYIAQEKVENLLGELKNKNQEILYCIDANYSKGTTPEQFLEKSRRQLVAIPCITPDRVNKRQNGRRFKEDGDPMFTITQQDRHGILQVGNIVSTGNFNNPQRGRIYNPTGISPSLNTVGGGGLEPKIIKYDIPQEVKVRKNEVNIERLKALLRESKIKVKLNNKQISNILSVPVTNVEHWFRKDNSFSIPQPEQWELLKGILGISTDEFNKGIMEFETKEGVFEKANRIYDCEGIAPTLTSATASEKILNNYRIRKLTPLECFRLMGFSDTDYNNAKDAGISNSQLYKQAGNSIVVNVIKKMVKANIELFRGL